MQSCSPAEHVHAGNDKAGQRGVLGDWSACCKLTVRLHAHACWKCEASLAALHVHDHDWEEHSIHGSWGHESRDLQIIKTAGVQATHDVTLGPHSLTVAATCVPLPL